MWYCFTKMNCAPKAAPKKWKESCPTIRSFGITNTIHQIAKYPPCHVRLVNLVLRRTIWLSSTHAKISMTLSISKEIGAKNWRRSFRFKWGISARTWVQMNLMIISDERRNRRGISWSLPTYSKAFYFEEVLFLALSTKKEEYMLQKDRLA